MNFAFSTDEEIVRDQVQRFLRKDFPFERLLEASKSDSTIPRGLWAAMSDMGLAGTAVPESLGGNGMGYVELCVIAEELGRAAVPGPFSVSRYLAMEIVMALGTADQVETLIPDLASGQLMATVDIAPLLHKATDSADPSLVVRDGCLSGTIGLLPEANTADIAIVVVATPGSSELGLYIVMLGDESLSIDSLESIDPGKTFARVSLNSTPAQHLGCADVRLEKLSLPLNRATGLFAFEQLGGAQLALARATDYAKERYAFGRAIGSFQAIKHMLADMYVATELARSNCFYAAWAISQDSRELPLAVAVAHMSASTAFVLCAKNNIQVHGGMGFTWEAGCHFLYRRAIYMAGLLGGQRVWTDRLVSRLEGEVCYGF